MRSKCNTGSCEAQTVGHEDTRILLASSFSKTLDWIAPVAFFGYVS